MAQSADRRGRAWRRIGPDLATHRRTAQPGRRCRSLIARLHAVGVPRALPLPRGHRPTSTPRPARFAGIDQAGLGLPDRDYYLKDDGDNVKHRADYHAYLGKLLVAAGHDAKAVSKEVDAVMALEGEIAKVSKDKVARRDPKAMYNKINRAGIDKAIEPTSTGPRSGRPSGSRTSRTSP